VLPSNCEQLSYLTTQFTVLRIFRLLKLERLTRAFKFLKGEVAIPLLSLMLFLFCTISVALANVFEVFLLTVALEALYFMTTSVLLYLIEPVVYPSIPSAMYTASLMLIGAEAPDRHLLSDGLIFVYHEIV
jgi:hypothetical protein